MSDPAQTPKYAPLDIRKEDWEAAFAFFNDPKNKDEVKFRRMHTEEVQNANPNLPEHSFIKVNGEIFALANKKAVFGHLLGKGGFGKVKLVQNEQGESFAVKIEGRGARGEDNTERKIMNILNYLKGEAVRAVSPRMFKNKQIHHKLYTVTRLRKGEELLNHLYFNRDRSKRKKLSYHDKLLMAFQSAQAIKYLQDKRIIHADIKPQNLMADIDENQVLIESIDYGLSLILPEGCDHIEIKGKMGTPGYMAPEITGATKDHPGIYSFSSDIFALGRMFLEDFALTVSPQYGFIMGRPKTLIDNQHAKLCRLILRMNKPDRMDRPSIDSVLAILQECLEFHQKIKEREKMIEELEESIEDLIDYKDSLVLKQSRLKYKVGAPLHLSKIDKRIHQVETIIDLINSNHFYTPEELKSNIEMVLKEIQAWRLPGKGKSNLQYLVHNLMDNLDIIIKARGADMPKASGR